MAKMGKQKKLSGGLSPKVKLGQRYMHIIPDSLPAINRVRAINILGVTLRDDLKAADHIDTVLVSCTIFLYAHRLLRTQTTYCYVGLPALPSTMLRWHLPYMLLRPGSGDTRFTPRGSTTKCSRTKGSRHTCC